MLRAGILNKRITLQRKASVQDEWGQPVEQWRNVATVWGNILTVSGRGFVNQELASGGTEIARATTSIRIRKRAGIDSTMRVVYGGQVYEIKAVLPDHDGDEYIDLAVIQAV